MKRTAGSPRRRMTPALLILVDTVGVGGSTGTTPSAGLMPDAPPEPSPAGPALSQRHASHPS
ncbi:hypothetical protein [Streptomyces sp. LARHCF252]